MNASGRENNATARPLLHIGYHKSGTTWLQRHVFSNSEAGFTRIAGGNLLQSAFIQANPFSFRPEVARKKFEPGMERARERDLIPVISHERLSGSPYAGGYDGGILADRLAAVFPDARALVVIREQKAMILSIYKMYVRMGGAASFEQFLSRPPGLARMPSFRFDFLEYHRLVGYYSKLFGAENILVLPYELLRAEPTSFLQAICDFAGVEMTASSFRLENVSPSSLILSLKRHINKLVIRDGLNPAPLLDPNIKNRALSQMLGSVDEKLPAALRERYEIRWRRYAEEQVGDLYAKSNTLTAKLTGLNLGEFGYPCA